MTKTITIPRLDDMHCHFRLGSLLEEVVPQTARYAGRAIVMPNTRPRAILTGPDVIWYRDEIRRVRDAMLTKRPFEPLMTIEIRDNTTREMVIDAHRAGAVAGKVYPLGATTNSDEGLRSFRGPAIDEVFTAMRDVGMLLLIHGEMSGEKTLVTKREEGFLPILLSIVERFRGLKIVLEHISTKTAVDTVRALGSDVAATITAHHLLLTLNDVIGDGIRPHNMCMPVPKDFGDREALLWAAISGERKFFLGSDSAPHVREKKECAHGACGVYSAPILPQLLAQIFDDAGCLERLEDFATRFGAEFYGLGPNTETITLTRHEEPWEVPFQLGTVVPFRAGTKLHWQLA